MTPQNLQAAFPPATEADAAAGWIIARGFLIEITDRVWNSGRRVAVSSIDVQTILLAAIELAPVASPPTEEEKTAAALSTEIDAFLTLGKHPAGRPLMRAIGISIDPDANERSFTVEVGHIDPAAVPLSEMLKRGPLAGRLADLTDSLCAPPPTANNQGEAAP